MSEPTQRWKKSSNVVNSLKLWNWNAGLRQKHSRRNITRFLCLAHEVPGYLKMAFILHSRWKGYGWVQCAISVELHIQCAVNGDFQRLFYLHGADNRNAMFIAVTNHAHIYASSIFLSLSLSCAHIHRQWCTRVKCTFQAFIVVEFFFYHFFLSICIHSREYACGLIGI